MHFRKNYLDEGWVDKGSNSLEKIRTLFYHVYHDLPRNWREGGFKVQARKQIAEYRLEYNYLTYSFHVIFSA